MAVNYAMITLLFSDPVVPGSERGGQLHWERDFESSERGCFELCQGDLYLLVPWRQGALLSQGPALQAAVGVAALRM